MTALHCGAGAWGCCLERCPGRAASRADAASDVSGELPDHPPCTFVVPGLSLGEQTATLEGTMLSGVAIRAEGTMRVVRAAGDD